MSTEFSGQALKEFLGEAEEIIEGLHLALLKIGDRTSPDDLDPELINSIFRGAHSLKGLAGMFGFNDVSELAHHMEDMLDNFRLGKIPLSDELIETIFESLEYLTLLVQGKSEDENYSIDITPVLSRIDAVLSGDNKPESNIFKQFNIEPSILNVLTEYEEHRLHENLTKGNNLFRIEVTFDLSSFDQGLAEISELLKQSGEIISTLPCFGELTERIAFQLLFGTAIGTEAVHDLVGNDAIKVTAIVSRAGTDTGAQPRPAESAEAIIDATAEDLAPAQSQADSASMRSISRTVRVDIDKLDDLMNIVGELVLSKGVFAEIAEKMKATGRDDIASSVQKATRELERKLDDLQKGVMEVRMVPIAQLFDKMLRIVRQVAKTQGKKVALDIQGADTELDKLIVEDLSDPLQHIIRNAIDHGIETPEERRRAGKPEQATICLWAFQKGNHVVIEIKDDGKGIDPEVIRAKAIKKKLVSANAELTRTDIYDLVFLSGFSTRDEVSELSGRGVGMDVVKNNIASLSGMIEIDSEVGKGTRIAITLPITLAIIKALIVQVSGTTYAVPINSVLETLMIEESSIRTIERKEVIELRQTTLPLLRLAEVFGLRSPQERASRCFVAVVGLAEKKIGIVVDDLLGQQDVVIKSLGSTLSFVQGISGAADLGNQKTILVLDVGGLMSEALRGDSNVHV
ncbi:MAG: chemotaxis protein CheA [Desulfuromonadales bacterium]|nr:chemotaxis protein CheA [Desulfuromonadales bacterium]